MDAGVDVDPFQKFLGGSQKPEAAAAPGEAEGPGTSSNAPERNRTSHVGAEPSRRTHRTSGFFERL